MPLNVKIQLIQSAIKAIADCVKLLGSTFVVFATLGGSIKTLLAYVIHLMH